MSDEAQSQMASMLAALVGAYVALSPLWTTMTHAAMISAIATGSVIAIASLWQLFSKSVFPSWLNAISAVWLIVGVLTLGSYGFETWSQIVAGVVVFLLAGWDGAEVAHYRHEHISTGSHV